MKELSFLQRAGHTSHPLAKKLFLLMEEKKTNLCVSADVTKQKDLLHLADQVGPHICMLKTHIDILEDFTPNFLHDLQGLAEKRHFLLFEDRKFADIGHTVSLQYKKGIYRIADWAHLVNAHILPGPGIIQGLKQEGLALNRGLLLLAQMSSKGALFSPSYTEKAVELAEKNTDFVIGFISLGRLSPKPYFLHLTPGVKLEEGKDSLGQQWLSVEEVVGKRKSDIIIVGRDILHAKDPQKQAKLYQERAWKCYEKRR